MIFRPSGGSRPSLPWRSAERRWRPLRILIDESLPRRLAREIRDASHVHDQAWAGFRNGLLLRAAAGSDFRVLITADRSLATHSDLRRLGIAVVVLVGVRNRIQEIRPLIPQILAAIATIVPGQSVRIMPSDSVRDRPLYAWAV